MTVSPNPRRWGALALIAVAQFLVIMDTSIIGVALPEIQRAIGFSQSELSWVFNAYVIAFGGLLLLGGRLADLFGAPRLHGRICHPHRRIAPDRPGVVGSDPTRRPRLAGARP